MVDVARLAGVALKTVSRVVSGEAAVAEGTTERAPASLASVNLCCNDIAGSLKYTLTTSCADVASSAGRGQTPYRPGALLTRRPAPR